jgi:hypothetical protein
MTADEHREQCATRFREVSAELALVRERWRALVAQREQLRGALAVLQDLTNGTGPERSDDVHHP